MSYRAVRRTVKPKRAGKRDAAGKQEVAPPKTDLEMMIEAGRLRYLVKDELKSYASYQAVKRKTWENMQPDIRWYTEQQSVLKALSDKSPNHKRIDYPSDFGSGIESLASLHPTTPRSKGPEIQSAVNEILRLSRATSEHIIPMVWTCKDVRGDLALSDHLTELLRDDLWQSPPNDRRALDHTQHIAGALTDTIATVLGGNRHFPLDKAKNVLVLLTQLVILVEGIRFRFPLSQEEDQAMHALSHKMVPMLGLLAESGVEISLSVPVVAGIIARQSFGWCHPSMILTSKQFIDGIGLLKEDIDAVQRVDAQNHLVHVLVEYLKRTSTPRDAQVLEQLGTWLQLVPVVKMHALRLVLQMIKCIIEQTEPAALKECIAESYPGTNQEAAGEILMAIKNDSSKTSHYRFMPFLDIMITQLWSPFAITPLKIEGKAYDDLDGGNPEMHYIAGHCRVMVGRQIGILGPDAGSTTLRDVHIIEEVVIVIGEKRGAVTLVEICTGRIGSEVKYRFELESDWQPFQEALIRFGHDVELMDFDWRALYR